jgi:electron transfer flavoprotein beta subunit
VNIAVCAKVTPDTATPNIKASADKSGIDTTGIKWVVSPYDLLAVTKGITLVEQKKAEKVSVFTVGAGENVISTLRGGALALGCAELVAVDDPAFAKTDALGIARGLAAAIGSAGGFQLVLCGKQAVDDDSVQVPAMIAEVLGWPLVSFVSKLDVEGDTFVATRNVGGGVEEIVKGQLPAVITADKGIAEERYAKLPDIMKAKTKPVLAKKLGDLGLSADQVAPAAVASAYGEPPPRPAGRVLKGELPAVLDELVGLLRNEAKVL